MAADASDAMSRLRTIVERARHCRAYLNYSLSPGTLTPGERVVLNLLNHQSEDGAFGSPEYPKWTDVLTSLSIQALRRAGFDRDGTWPVSDGDRRFTGGIQKAITYLANKRTEHGWGEDIHDTCQALIALLEFRDQREINVHVRWGLQFVVKELETDFRRFEEGNWFGPGFWAAALDLLSRTSTHKEECVKILTKLNGMQHPDGYFGGARMPTPMKLWHTALAVMALSYGGIPTSSPKIEQALAWMERTQEPNGEWGAGLDKFQVIFVGYGALAFYMLRGPESPVTQRAMNWMIERQRPDGSIEGIEGVVMGALCLPQLDKVPSQLMSITNMIEIDRVLGDLEPALDDVTRLLKERGDQDYLIRISNRRAGQIGLLIGLLGLILAVVSVLPLLF